MPQGQYYGRAVRYVEQTRTPKGDMALMEFDALVLQEHGRLASHQGQGGQPLVHLIIVEDAKEHLNLADPSLKVIVRHDVAHATHRFTDEQKEHFGKDYYEGGRWSEYGTSPLEIWSTVKLAEEADKAAKSVNG